MMMMMMMMAQIIYPIETLQLFPIIIRSRLNEVIELYSSHFLSFFNLEK